MKKEDIRKRSQLRKRIKQIQRARKIILYNLRAIGRHEKSTREVPLVEYDYPGAQKLRRNIAYAMQAIKEDDVDGITYYNDLFSKVRICMHVIFPS